MAAPSPSAPALWLLALLAVAAAGAAGKAPNPPPLRLRIQEADIDRILTNNRVVSSYVKCLLDKQPCSPEGAQLKGALPDALATDCRRCSANEKLLSRKVIAHLMTKRRGDWEQLLAKYDPKGEYARRYGLRAVPPAPARHGKSKQHKPK